MKNGLFIVFEGPDGAGKTTILKKVYDELSNRGLKCIATREPGGIDISEQIRNVILDKKNTAMDGRTEALLYAAARRQHLVEKVVPALNEGYIVLCDRFLFSSLAYQGYARGIGIDEVYEINKFAIDNNVPDLTLYFDIAPETALARIAANSSREVNRLDLENIAFHNKVSEGYNIIINKYNINTQVICGDQPINDVYIDTMKVINRIIE